MIRLKKLFSIPHTKCFVFCFGLLLSILFVCVFFTSSSSALNLSNTGDMWIDQIQYERGIYGNQNWSLNTVSPPSNTNQLQWSFSINNMNAGNEISRLYIKYKSEPAGPALISFDISYYITSPNSAFAPIYNGLKFKNRYVLLNDSCINSVGVPMVVGSNNVYAFECTYLVYASSTTSKSIDTEAGSPIFSAAGTNNSLTMRIGPANYVEVSNDGLSASDRSWLEAHLPAGTSQADIEQAVEDAIDAAGIVAAQNATTNAIRSQTQQQHDDYESEVEREEAKQEELEDQAGDLSLSASSTGNPFANMFNASGCVNMPIVGGWFGNPNLKVCSPYPATIANILNFVGSAIIVGFLIRIYYKHMNGGYQS